jgi:hypothetical protein
MTYFQASVTLGVSFKIYLHGYFLFSVLRQFKIVKPTRKGKRQTSFTKYVASAFCVDVKHDDLMYFIYKQ